MSRNFSRPGEPYPQLREAFVNKVKPERTPPHLARHRSRALPSRSIAGMADCTVR